MTVLYIKAVNLLWICPVCALVGVLLTCCIVVGKRSDDDD